MNLSISDKEKNKSNVVDNIKLEKAYFNYNKIIEKKLKNKFGYLDEWLLKKSKILLKETECLEDN